MHEVTRILSDIEQGDPNAAEQLLPLVYAELRKLARQSERCASFGICREVWYSMWTFRPVSIITRFGGTSGESTRYVPVTRPGAARD